ncbi:MAG: efflux RND transporter permease subunit [Nitrosomonas sp.]|nr:efflux RND transporter permease subunit [Nitrosomonas sp.]
MRGLDVRLALTDLANAKSQLAQAKNQLQQITWQLEVLLGQYPADGWQKTADAIPESSDPPSFPTQQALPDPPRLLPAGLPSDLLARRPDLIAAFSRLLAADARKRFHVREIVTSWYRHIGDFGDFKPDFHIPTEKSLIDLEIELLAQDPEILNAAADAVKARIMRYPGIADLSDSRKPGKPEIRFRLKPEGERLGLRLKDLAEQVRHAYYGEEVQRFMRGRFEVKFQVRHLREERETIQDLLAMSIRLPSGGQAQLGMLADIDFALGFGALMRADRMGVVKLHVQLVDSPPVSASVIDQELATQFFPALEQQYRGIKISRGEAAKEADEIMAGLKRNTLIALAMIYALLAVTFKSYIQPLLFLLTVPVAWLGAVLIHWLMGLNFSFQSLVGMVAASGVVVDDSVVLLHFIRKRREEFTHFADLIVNVCVSRFRPILLVALTSIAGFAPMLFETSEQAKFLVPVTLSLAAGLSFGMIATLVLVPVCYAMLSDGRQLLIRFRKTES